MDNNPYSIVFGSAPRQMINRFSDEQDIYDAFTAEASLSPTYIITGVRGSGKTVLLTNLKDRFLDLEDWIVVELSIESDLLQSLASKLNEDKKLVKMFKEAKINLSLLGLGVEITGEPPVRELDTAIEKMLRTIRNKGKKLLVLIDEVYKNEYMKKFASMYQIYIRDKLPIYLLMTGLYENIKSLQDDKGLTFLYRTPRIEIGPLGISRIKNNYKKVIGLDDSIAAEAAKLTKGYSYAFQLMGFILWRERQKGALQEISEDVVEEYSSFLEEYSYDKIWEELSTREKEILGSLAKVPNGEILKIRENINMDTNNFNPYRKRLIRKGVIKANGRGYIEFQLPLFGEYINENYM